MHPHDRAPEIPRLMKGFRAGEKESSDRLFELFYQELRRMAASRMRRERSEHSWQPTLLVNELYLELMRRKALGGDAESPDERNSFLGLAGFLMRRLLILHSRPISQNIRKIDDASLEWAASPEPTPESLQEVDSLLDRLGTLDPRLRRVVECRVFEGKSHEEIAAELECSVRTVSSCWSFAREWLRSQLEAEGSRRV